MLEFPARSSGYPSTTSAWLCVGAMEKPASPSAHSTGWPVEGLMYREMGVGGELGKVLGGGGEEEGTGERVGRCPGVIPNSPFTATKEVLWQEAKEQ